MQLLKVFWGGKAAFVAMQTKSKSRLDVEDDLFCTLPCIEPRISLLLTTNRLNLRIDCSARFVIKCCFYICSVHLHQLSHWRSCTVGGPQILFVY